MFPTGDQGNQWHFGKAELKPGRFVLKIEGYAGNGVRGDIAIDDFTIYNRSCSSYNQDVWSIGFETVLGLAYEMMGEYPEYVGDYPGHGKYTMKEMLCYGKGKDHDMDDKPKDGGCSQQCGGMSKPMPPGPMYDPFMSPYHTMGQHQMIVDQHQMIAKETHDVLMWIKDEKCKPKMKPECMNRNITGKCLQLSSGQLL